MGIHYHIHFNFYVHCFVHDTFQDIFHTHFTEFMPIICTRQYFSPTTLYWTKIIGLYRTAREAGKFQAPTPKTQEKKLKRHQIQLLSVLPPRDVCFKENQARHTVITHNDSLPAPLITTQPERKEVPTPLTRQEPMTRVISTADTNISQVTPLLGTTPR